MDNNQLILNYKISNIKYVELDLHRSSYGLTERIPTIKNNTKILLLRQKIWIHRDLILISEYNVDNGLCIVYADNQVWNFSLILYAYIYKTHQ